MRKLYARIVPKRLFGSIRISQGSYSSRFQTKTVSPTQEVQAVVPDPGYDALTLVTVEAASLQEKTVRPSSIDQTIVPDVGVYGLAKVVVAAQGNSGLLQEKTVEPDAEEQIITPDEGYYGLSSVSVKGTPLESKAVVPGKEMQIVKPDEGTYGLSFVFVSGEENLIPENIKSGVSIYGVEGTGLKLQDKAFTPTGKVMVCYPDEGYDGFSFVGIGGDNNLLPENIKKNVTIYGVTGSLDGGGGGKLSASTDTEYKVFEPVVVARETSTAYMATVSVTGIAT